MCQPAAEVTGRTLSRACSVQGKAFLGKLFLTRGWFCAASPLRTATSLPTHASEEAPARGLRPASIHCSLQTRGYLYSKSHFSALSISPSRQAKRQLKGLLVTSPLFNEAWSYGQVTPSAVIICMSGRGRGSSGVHRAPTNVHIDHG